MTDVPTDLTWDEVSVPGRLGVSARLDGEELVLDLVPRPEVLHLGMVRASVLSYLVDALAGIPLDLGMEDWTFTTDLSVRTVPVPAPALVVARGRILRRGKRSSSTQVELAADDGTLLGTGVAGFANVPRRPDDPRKAVITLDLIVEHLRDEHRLDRPLRDAAGIRVLDASAGVVELDVSPIVHNPAGTLQGAMVALAAEAAAEDLLAARVGEPVVVTDLDIRYLARTGAGPVRSRSRIVGSGPDPAVEVELVDLSTGTLTTIVYARASRLT